jgi:hypothetical protein
VEEAELGYYASLWTAFIGMSSINLASSPYQRPCELLSLGFVRRPSYVVNFSHFNLLLGKWYLDSPLLKWCPVIPASNQDGRQAKNSKKGG